MSPYGSMVGINFAEIFGSDDLKRERCESSIGCKDSKNSEIFIEGGSYACNNTEEVRGYYGAF
jgi:hypothetical protein